MMCKTPNLIFFNFLKIIMHLKLLTKPHTKVDNFLYIIKNQTTKAIYLWKPPRGKKYEHNSNLNVPWSQREKNSHMMNMNNQTKKSTHWTWLCCLFCDPITEPPTCNNNQPKKIKIKQSKKWVKFCTKRMN